MCFTVIVTAKNPTLSHRSLRSLGRPKHCRTGQWSGTRSVNKGNFEELLQSRGKSLSNEELPELAQQHTQSEISSSDAEGKHQ